MKKNREFFQEILNSNLDTSVKGISEISKVKLKNIAKKIRWFSFLDIITLKSTFSK